MQYDEMRALITDLVSGGGTDAEVPATMAAAQQRVEDAAAAAATITAERATVSGQRLLVERRMRAVDEERRTRGQERATMLDRLRDASAVQALGVRPAGLDADRALAERLSSQAQDLARERAELEAVAGTLAARMQRLAEEERAAQARVARAQATLQQAQPTDLRARHRRGEELRLMDIAREGGAWVIWLHAAGATYRLTEADDYIDPAPVRLQEGRPRTAYSRGGLLARDGRLTLADVAALLGGAHEQSDRPLIAVHATPPQPVTQETRYQVIVSGGKGYELEIATLAEYTGWVGGRPAAPAAV